METRANYALIGAFVLLAVALGAGFVLWLGQSEFRRDFKTYDIVFDGPVSLEEGAAVRYIGIKVGEVATVRIDRADSSKVRARVRIDRATPVRVDSTASIQLAGITGITFVQITAGTGKGLEARPGEPVPVIPSEITLVNQLVSGGARALGNANMAFDQINLMLTNENIASVNASLRNIEIITTRLAAGDGLIGQASATLTDVSNASLAFEAASKDLQDFGNTADLSIAEAGADFKALVADLRGAVATADAAIGASQTTIEAVTTLLEGPATETIGNANAVSQDLRVLINRLDRMTREIERNPQGFVVGTPAPYEK